MPDANWEVIWSLLRGIADEWHVAEQDIKLAEQVCSKVAFPSIKELRYAGRKIVEVLIMLSANTDPPEIESKLRDIRHDCHRARHDAVDAGTAKIASDLRIMVQKLGYGPITSTYPRFAELHGRLNAVRTKIAESRRNINSRDRIYSGMEKDEFPSLVEMYSAFLSAEPIMRGLAAAERRHSALVLGVGLIEGLVLIVALLEHWRDTVAWMKLHIW